MDLKVCLILLFAALVTAEAGRGRHRRRRGDRNYRSCWFYGEIQHCRDQTPTWFDYGYGYDDKPGSRFDVDYEHKRQSGGLKYRPACWFYGENGEIQHCGDDRMPSTWFDYGNLSPLGV